REKDDLKGFLFVSSGLGGMSGAQPKAADIANAVSIVAEVDLSRIETRQNQGWVKKVAKSEKEAFDLAKEYLERKEGMSIAYYGNIVELLEYATKNNIKIDLLSDQTSCHAPYEGGYCPSSIDFDERTRLLEEDRELFRTLIDKTLIKHYNLIKKLTERGTYFFDYGNSFMKAVYDAGGKSICKNGENERDGFIFPSYVEDIMGPELFDYGYGPFRWVCLSGKKEDLDITDKTAMDLIQKDRRAQDMDNYNWIKGAKENNLVVGSKARILYQDAEGRLRIALAFNKLVRDKKVGPIMLGRDHHDTGGTDSPFRETANIKDGSNMTADMAVQSFAGNAARGMSMIALHSGGGVGAGKSINGGFGVVLDGSQRVDKIIEKAFPWDVMGGVARRSWARNKNAVEAAKAYNEKEKGYITIPELVDESIFDDLFGGKDE
ncbi:MAG: urocanate hydratase, partial [Clostridium sp.]|nr:urocanate hydratase [Clostridium sp.]